MCPARWQLHIERSYHRSTPEWPRGSIPILPCSSPKDRYVSCLPTITFSFFDPSSSRANSKEGEALTRRYTVGKFEFGERAQYILVELTCFHGTLVHAKVRDNRTSPVESETLLDLNLQVMLSIDCPGKAKKRKERGPTRTF